MSSEQVWEELRSQRERPVFRRVDNTHPHDIYLGIDSNDAPLLMLLSSTSVRQVPRLKALHVSQNIRSDGKMALLVTLANHELLHPFRYVCDDLVESLRHYAAADEAEFLIRRLEKWRRLLEAGKRGLSHSEILGLSGELLFLLRLAEAIGPTAAVDAWLGPSGAPQDFQSGGHLYEIKACAIGGHSVVISSLEQLHTGAMPTVLVVYCIGSSTIGAAGALTVSELVISVRQLVAETPASSAFELKLAEVGYDENQPEVGSPFIANEPRAFDVRDAFPRLTPMSVPGGVSSATYCIDLDQCVEFEVPITRVLDYES